MNLECNSKNLLVVNSVCMCASMFNIVSFMLNMVLTIVDYMAVLALLYLGLSRHIVPHIYLFVTYI